MDRMFDTITQHIKVHLEKIVSKKTGEMNDHVLMLFSACWKETSVNDKADAVKVQRAGIEIRTHEEHATLVDTINPCSIDKFADTSL